MGSRTRAVRRTACSVVFCLLGGTAWAAGNGATVIPGAPGEPPVVIPPSSVVRPEDTGRRVHTNTRVLQLPQGAGPPSTRAPRPQISPGSGYNYETPTSLACVYG